MAYHVDLANRVREKLQNLENIEEKEMMGGLIFMYNDKMCLGIIKDDLVCRIDQEIWETLLEKNGCRALNFKGKTIKGYLLLDQSVLKSANELESWMKLALDYNPRIKVSKKGQKK